MRKEKVEKMRYFECKIFPALHFKSGWIISISSWLELLEQMLLNRSEHVSIYKWAFSTWAQTTCKLCGKLCSPQALCLFNLLLLWLLLFVFVSFLITCLWRVECACVRKGVQRLEDGVGCPEAGITGVCELPPASRCHLDGKLHLHFYDYYKHKRLGSGEIT